MDREGDPSLRILIESKLAQETAVAGQLACLNN